MWGRIDLDASDFIPDRRGLLWLTSNYPWLEASYTV